MSGQDCNSASSLHSQESVSMHILVFYYNNTERHTVLFDGPNKVDGRLDRSVQNS
jgi:hypothetical protein